MTVGEGSPDGVRKKRTRTKAQNNTGSERSPAHGDRAQSSTPWRRKEVLVELKRIQATKDGIVHLNSPDAIVRTDRAELTRQMTYREISSCFLQRAQLEGDLFGLDKLHPRHHRKARGNMAIQQVNGRDLLWITKHNWEDAKDIVFTSPSPKLLVYYFVRPPPVEAGRRASRGSAQTSQRTAPVQEQHQPKKFWSRVAYFFARILSFFGDYPFGRYLEHMN